MSHRFSLCFENPNTSAIFLGAFISFTIPYLGSPKENKSRFYQASQLILFSALFYLVLITESRWAIISLLLVTAYYFRERLLNYKYIILFSLLAGFIFITNPRFIQFLFHDRGVYNRLTLLSKSVIAYAAEPITGWSLSAGKVYMFFYQPRDIKAYYDTSLNAYLDALIYNPCLGYTILALSAIPITFTVLYSKKILTKFHQGLFLSVFFLILASNSHNALVNPVIFFLYFFLLSACIIILLRDHPNLLLKKTLPISLIATTLICLCLFFAGRSMEIWASDHTAQKEEFGYSVLYRNAPPRCLVVLCDDSILGFPAIRQARYIGEWGHRYSEIVFISKISDALQKHLVKFKSCDLLAGGVIEDLDNINLNFSHGLLINMLPKRPLRNCRFDKAVLIYSPPFLFRSKNRIFSIEPKETSLAILNYPSYRNSNLISFCLANGTAEKPE